MTRQLAVFVWILFLLTLAVEPVAAQKMETLFYAVDTEASLSNFQRHVDAISIIAPQTYSVDERGILSGAVDSRILSLAREKGVKVMPLVINPGFNQPMIHKLLFDPSAQDLAIASMIEQCRQHGFYGFQFDLENVNVADKEALTRFYRKAADAFHEKGLALSIAVVPRTSDFAGSGSYSKWIFENWRGAYDYKALAEAGDFISLMTYDQHTAHTPPGPVAGLPWMEAVIDFALKKEVPPGKISLGIPLYSDHWFPEAQGEQARSWGREISFDQAEGLAQRFAAVPEWDNREKTSFTHFERDGVYEYLFIEEARSFEAKLELVKKYNLRGLSAWRLGMEDERIWNALPTEAR